MDKIIAGYEIINQELNTGKKKNWIARTVPWLIGGSVLVYLIWRIEPQPLIKALAQAQLMIYIPAVLVFIYISFLVDMQNFRALMKHFGYLFTLAESMAIRGASYLIVVIDYTLGLGSIVYFLKETRQIPLGRGTAIMIYYNYINQIALLLLAVGGYPLLGMDLPWLTRGLIACILLLCLTVLVIGIIKSSGNGLAKKIRKAVLAQPFVESSFRTYLLNTIYRMGYYCTYILFFYVAVRAFGMEIPFITLIAYVPIILLVISIPISPFGLGTSQAAMLLLFKSYGSQPQILAFSLTYSVSLLLLRALIGAYYYWLMARRITLNEGLARGGYESERKADCERA